MPELRETVASCKSVQNFLKHAKESATDLTVLGLWADASDTRAEAKLATGHVYKLSPASTVKRGPKSAQSCLYPQMMQATASNADPLPLSNLVLKSAANTNRAIVLDFGALAFQLAYLTHTSVQIFKRKVWEDTVQPSVKKSRGYCIGLAIEFKEYFLAFLTIDQVFKVTWAKTVQDLPDVAPDIYSNYLAFLQLVADWITTRATNSKRLGLACAAIRTQGNKVWVGVGVYTVCEIFADAGISPFLTEKEVFDSPSRTARLCEALWCYAYKSHTHLHELLQPATHDGILAPSTEQRLSYKRWLHVYGKARSELTLRQACLWDNYEAKFQEIEKNPDIMYSREDINLADVFEPDNIYAAFTKKSVNLGALIFGEQHARELHVPPSSECDPLTKMFSTRVGLGQTTHLSDTHYTELFTGSVASGKKSSWRYTYTYRIENSKQIWAITRNFPTNLQPRNGSRHADVIAVADDMRKKMLFEYIIKHTKKVAIGPLEYCGNGTVVRTTHSKTLVHAVRATRREILSFNKSQVHDLTTLTPDEHLSDDVQTEGELYNLSYDSHPTLKHTNWVDDKKHCLPEGRSSSSPTPYLHPLSSASSACDGRKRHSDSHAGDCIDNGKFFSERRSMSPVASSSLAYSRSLSSSSSPNHNRSNWNVEDPDPDSEPDVPRGGSTHFVFKKRRVTYSTADREISMKFSTPHNTASVEEGKTRPQRLKEGGHPIFYGRKKRPYNKKTQERGGAK